MSAVAWRKARRWRIRHISSLRPAAGIYQVSLRDGLGGQQVILVREGEHSQVVLTAWQTPPARLGAGSDPLSVVQTTVQMQLSVRRIG